MLRALLLDLDGTLVLTEALHWEASRATMARFGRAIDLDFYRRHIHGMANADIATAQFPGREATDGAAYVAAKEQAFRDSLATDVPTVPGAHALLDAARRAGLKLAVVTNAPRANAELLLRPYGGAGAFDALVLGDELAFGKPHPLPYLEAMRLLGVSPGQSLGFEDSTSGLKAVAAAGVFAIGIGPAADEASLRAAGADLVVDDYTDPRLAGAPGLADLLCHAQA
jgi:HAD superfamily hydrolase (TIGR01509 family)